MQVDNDYLLVNYLEKISPEKSGTLVKGFFSEEPQKEVVYLFRDYKIVSKLLTMDSQMKEVRALEFYAEGKLEVEYCMIGYLPRE